MPSVLPPPPRPQVAELAVGGLPELELLMIRINWLLHLNQLLVILFWNWWLLMVHWNWLLRICFILKKVTWLWQWVMIQQMVY
jgi:hypothetical protein